MPIRAHELARLLLSGPNLPVETWQNASRYPVEACDADIEAVVQVVGYKGHDVIVLGMDMAELQGEVLWTDRPGIAKTTGEQCAKGKVAV